MSQDISSPHQEICRKFFRKAHCIRGERCPFKHTLTETPAPSAELLAGPSTLEKHKQRQRKRKAERAITRCQEVATAVFRDLNFVDSVGEADLTRLFQPMPLCPIELIQWSSVPDSIQISREFHPDRAERKRWQVENMANVLDRMLGYYTGLGRPVRMVDFGSGAGNVSLPLAWRFQDRVEIILLDMKPACIELAAARASDAGLHNVRCIVGRIEDFSEPFDVCLSVHSCGSASDLAQLSAFAHRASFILCPCCLGKIVHNPSLSFPRSQALRDRAAASDYALIAAAADHTEAETNLGNRLCKALIEFDRVRAAAAVGYATLLTRLVPLEASPKHDVLVGVPSEVFVNGGSLDCILSAPEAWVFSESNGVPC